ncbi:MULTISPECIES: Spaf_1101 family AAA-like ATPase [Bacteria][Archaea]|uniref:Spaf_1101 family AAA-like ATPase n=1 Tax=Bacteria TaxID=2 RepID=UPI0025E9EE0C|nr:MULTISPECIES: hypothetical protein [Bacteria]
MTKPKKEIKGSSMANFNLMPNYFDPPDVKKAYEAINSEKEKFGKYHKAIFHVHTPESYDYKFYEEWGEELYKGKTAEEIAEIFFKLYNPEATTSFIHSPEDIDMFDDEKQFWSFLALAKTIVDKEIEIIVVADHNTINGVKKLEEAIKLLNNLSPLKIYPEIIGGVEITCADRLHVVGIFDFRNRDTIKFLKEWLHNSLYSLKDGVIKTSLDVIQILRQHSMLSYIAHINTSEMLNGKKIYSSAYRKELFGLEELMLLGINDISKAENVKQRLREIGVKHREVNFILDNDSHSIDTIDNNIVWIKGEKIDYDMIAEAINDYDVSIALERFEQPNIFIKGVYVETKYLSTNTNFLVKNKGQTDDSFVIRFSNALNCIIGGRGTGKSTLLKLLEFALTLKCNDSTELEYLCRHGNIWILFEKENEQYIVGMLLPYLDDEKAKDYYYLAPQKEIYDDYRRQRVKDKIEKVKRESFNKLIKVYKVDNIKDKKAFPAIKDKNEKSKILKELYDTSYSVNDLVNITNDEKKLTSFLKSRFLVNQEKFPPLSKSVRFKNHNEFKQFIKRIPIVLREREENVVNELREFNEQKNNTLKIEYKQQNDANDEFSFVRCFESNSFSAGKYFFDYSIDSNGIYDYLNYVLNKMTIFEFFNMVTNRRQELYKYSILPYVRRYEKRGIQEINKDNQTVVIDKIIDILLSDYNINNYITEFFRRYLDSLEKFELFFDLTSNSTDKRRAHDFRNVKQISLGQKVIAMLSFILAFSDYNRDFRPLLIDQPEDNLDSQYIYGNLVQRLRQIKDKRQVIIATHNATIVTNAMADQVCVMYSDGKNGWIETRGYPGTERIKKAIIKYLEGGTDSFKHKEKIYRKVLDNT